jgi:hypothetical protein
MPASGFAPSPGGAPFYVTGGTLRQDAPSYVERQADRDLLDGLLAGEFCHVLTSRQMGKSSLMVHTAARLREAGVRIAVIDLTAIGQYLSAEQWYEGLIRRVGLQLDLEEELEAFSETRARLSPLQRWLTALEEVVLRHCPERIVILLDEIDAVRSLPFSTDEFFAAIRECYNRRAQEPAYERLTFCLLGVATPSDLIADTRTTPFNIGRRIELTDFTAAEAAPLASGLGRDGYPRGNHLEESGGGFAGVRKHSASEVPRAGRARPSAAADPPLDRRPPLPHPAALPGGGREWLGDTAAGAGPAVWGAVLLAQGTGAGGQPAVRAGAAAAE